LKILSMNMEILIISSRMSIIRPSFLRVKVRSRGRWKMLIVNSFTKSIRRSSIDLSRVCRIDRVILKRKTSRVIFNSRSSRIIVKITIGLSSRLL